MMETQNKPGVLSKTKALNKNELCFTKEGSIWVITNNFPTSLSKCIS